MSAPDPEPSSAGQAALRVMVVEDEPGLNRVIRQALERAGFQPIEALSGADAVRVLADNAPDIVLLDYTSPGMSAEEALDRIGMMEPAPAAIVMTGHGNEKIAADMLRRGVCDYIVKDNLFFSNLMHAVSRAAQDLTRARELKRLQAEMADNEARFRALYEEAPLPYQSIDSEGRILQVNHAWLRLFGYEADDVLGRHITSVLTPESCAEFAARFGTDGLEHDSESVEAHFVTRSGASVPVRVFCRVLRDEQGNFVRTHCILQDLTEVRRAEAEAHRREQDYRRIVETTQEGVWAMDERMRTTFVNARMCELLGYAEDELMGKPVSALIADDEMADHEERMRRRMQGVSERYVRLFKTADGGVRPLLVAATPVIGEHGEFEGSFAMFTDMGELLDRQRALEEAERKTASILRAAPVGIGLVRGRVLVEVNDALCSMLGYSREELIGQSARMIYPDEDEFERVGREKYAQSSAIGYGVVETRWRRKDGVVLDVQLSSSAVDPENPERGMTFTAMDITDIKRSERALKDAVDYWQRTFDAVPDMVCILDSQQRIKAANSAMCRRLRAEPEELMGRHCYEVMHQLGAPPEWCPHRRLSGPGTRSAEMVEPHLGGAFTVTVTPILAPEGTVTGSVHVVHDITERIKAEHETRQSRDFLECIIDAIADPLFVKDAEHRWVLVNEANCRLVGLSRTEMLGQSDHAFFPREQADAFWADDDEVLSTGQTKRSTQALTDATGQTRTLITTKALYVDSEGEKFIVGVSKDVSELTRAREEAQRGRARLDSLYRLALGEFATDSELMAFALEEAVKLTGSEVGYAHFVGTGEVDMRLFAWSSKALEQCSAPLDGKYPIAEAGVWADCARLKSPVIYNDYQSLPERKGYPEGHIHLTRHMSVPVLDEGRVVMIAGVGNKREPYDETDAHDFRLYMTEVWQLLRRRQAELELRRSHAEISERVKERTKQLEDAVAELDAFSYSLSHDLMTPLRNIDQYCGYLSEECSGVLDHEGRRYLERIRAGVAKMREMSQGLLDLSRSTRGDLSRSRVDMSGMALEILDEMRAAEPERNVTIHVEDGLTAEADQRMVRVMLQNLLGNAWKYTSKTEEARIEFGAAEVEGKRAFFVRDNGAGFDSSKAKRLFTAFQRFHHSAEFPGLGIGLATVRRAVHRHGGSIWAESEPGHGATFYFTLEG